MAGDWVIWTKGLEKKSEVARMAKLLSISIAEVCLKLMKFWAWCDEEIPNDSVKDSGSAFHVLTSDKDADMAFIDAEIVGLPSFAKSLASVEWIFFRNGRIEIPNFGRWNLQTAKTRLRNSKNQKSRRNYGTSQSVSPQDCDKKVTNVTKMSPPNDEKKRATEQNITETTTHAHIRAADVKINADDHDKKTDPDPSPIAPVAPTEPEKHKVDEFDAEAVEGAWSGLPEVLNSEDFKTKWHDFVNYRDGSETHGPIPLGTIPEIWRRLADLGSSKDAIEAISITISSGHKHVTWAVNGLLEKRNRPPPRLYHGGDHRKSNGERHVTGGDGFGDSGKFKPKRFVP